LPECRRPINSPISPAHTFKLFRSSDDFVRVGEGDPVAVERPASDVYPAIELLEGGRPGGAVGPIVHVVLAMISGGRN